MIKAIRKNWDKLYQVSEWIALFVVMNYYAIECFMGSTTFGIKFPGKYVKLTFLSVVAYGIFRLIIGVVNDIIHTDKKKQRFFILLKAALGILFTVPFIITAHRFGYGFLVYLPFLAFCLYGAKREHVMKIYFVCVGILLAATILSSLSGAIPNYLYLGHGARGVLRGSYGIGYPTDFAAYLVYLFLFAWGSGRFKNWRYTAFAVGLALLMAYMIYTYPRGINGTICSLLIAVVVFYDGLSERVLSRHKATRWITKVVDWLTIGAFPLFAAIVYGLTWLYGKGNSIAVRINKIISNRLYFIWYSYEKYGLHWFGASTPQKGGGLLANDEYEFIDSSYGVILIRFGVIALVIIAAVWVWMTWKAVRTGHRRIALVMAVIAFHSIIEQRFTEINILLTMPLCCFAIPEVTNVENKTDNKDANHIKKVVGWSVGTIVTVIFLLLVPKILSVARSLVVLKGWSGNVENAINILFFWLGCFVLFALLGYFIYDIIITIAAKKKITFRTLSGFAAVVLSMTAGLIWVNTSISEGLSLYQTQIETDTSVVDLILESAEEPVYVGHNEELYKRSFSGLSDHVLSPEEMSRSGQGSMLLDHDDGAFQLIGTGARYAEISPYTGLFTYDDAVIESLSNKGYRFHGYFSAERNVDFVAQADLNKLPLTTDGKLQLNGDAQSLKYGPCFSQLSGNYSVTFSLQLTSSYTDDPEAEICKLRTSSMWGRKIWNEHIVYLKDLDENGNIVVTLNYSTGSTEGVEYLVFCCDGIEMNVESISWKSIAEKDIWRDYTPDGVLLRERYFNGDGEPLIQPAGHYGISYNYADGIKQWIKAIYLDTDGKTPKKISSGYAQIERKLNKLEKVTEERYFDINGEPCMCTGNYACIRRTFDSRGNELTTSYYDTEDKLIRINSGYAEIHKEYDEKNRVIKESYYGSDGKPAVLNKNQAGVEYEYDDDDNKICWRYLDVNGDPTMITDGYAEMHRSYNDKKWVTEESYYDAEGNLLVRPNGYAVRIRSYDNVGNVLSERYLDTERQPVRNTSGYAEIRKVYNTDNRVIHEAYFDTDGSPLTLSKNQAAVEYGYDELGNTVLIRYLDTDDNPVLLTDGWAELHRVYNVKKQIIEESFYDVDGNLLLRPNGYAVAQYAYDDANNRNSERYFDTERNPVRNTSGYAELHRVFDNRNRVIKDSYFDENGAPIALPKNQASVEYGYDEMGNTVLYRYLDTEGKPVLLTDNYSELRRVYSASRKLLEESYYDTEGNASDIYGRYAKYENKYDDNNNLTLTYFTNATGDRVQCGSSYFHEFLQSLKNRDITIFISIKDEGTKNLTNMLLDDLKEIGIKTDLKDKYRYSFYAVVKQGVSQENFSNTESISNSGQFDDVSYSITSAGGLVGNTSSIIINGEEYSKNTRGMNFVIVDSKTGEVIDSVAFDTYSFDMWPTR